MMVQNQEQPKYPSTGDEMKKLWHIHTMEYNL